MTGIDIILLAVFLLGYCVASLHGYHMFQLNSYKTGIHIRWLIQEIEQGIKENSSRAFNVLTIGILGGVLLGIPRFWHWFFCLNLFCACIVWDSWGRKTPKNLMYTSRVKRMFATHSIIIALILFLMLPITGHRQIMLLLLLVIFASLIVILVNFINFPIEKAIGKPAPVSDADSCEKIDENHGGCND